MLTKRFDPLKGERLQIMDPEGKIAAPDPSQISAMNGFWNSIELCFWSADNKVLQLQRQGRMLTYAPNTGQEAAQVGSAAALQETDWLVPAFRELGAWSSDGLVWTRSIYIGTAMNGAAIIRRTSVCCPFLSLSALS